uniref:Reverse transcriptase Ty1/copia-type domain-containing protein n=1 Tax=Nicotiana tabacum TaxID=4097 RepID=A0A1S3ZSA2_TOBAC|nr:PREDICTED: uncharacterized protein LOC107789823 [Nicotiana tabacum]
MPTSDNYEANLTGTPKALLVSDEPYEWIIDTGATNHMVYDIDMLNKSSITEIEKPKKVFLPNGDITQVTHIGASSLSDKNTITNVFYVPQFKFNLLSVSKSTKELKCSVTVFPDFCFFQDLFTRKVREIGKEEDELYILLRQIMEKNKRIALAASKVESNLDKQLDVDLWHKRLGHMSTIVLQKILPISLQFISEKICGDLTKDETFREDIFPFSYRNKTAAQPLFVDPTLHTGITLDVIPESSLTNTTSEQHNQDYEVSASQELSGTDTNIPSSPIKDVHLSSQKSEQIVVDQQIPEKIQPQQMIVRKSTRDKNPPIWMRDFVSLNIHRDEPYAINKYLGYDQLSSKYQAYMSAFSSINRPTSYSEAVKDHRWVEAMNEEIKALENNNTWDIITLQKFKQSQFDYSLFIKRTSEGSAMIFVYVDDMLITGDSLKLIEETKQSLQKAFKMKDLGELKYFLSIEFARSKYGIIMHQRKYALELISEAGLSTAKPAGIKSEEDPLTDQQVYQRLIGKLLYLTVTRPDISFGVQTLSQFLQQPKKSHMDAALRIIGLLALLPEVSKSSAEAEYRSLATSVAKLIWLIGLLKEVDADIKLPVEIYCDSKAAIQIAANSVYHERTKHIEIDCHFIRERIQQGLITTKYIATKEQPIDLLTKGLSKVQHEYLNCKLGVLNIFTPPNLRGSVKV